MAIKQDGSGNETARFTDPEGVEWTLVVTFVQRSGRIEVSGVNLDSDGRGALTSTTFRRSERLALGLLAVVRATFGDMVDVVDGVPMFSLAGPNFDEVKRTMKPPPSRRPSTSDQPMPRSRNGPRRNDELWRRRAEAMASAWRQGVPMITALRDLEPGSSTGVYQQRINRARKWDQETGSGILDGVGRSRASRGEKSESTPGGES